MALLHNGRVTDRLSLAADDRAFAYADGIFETMIVHPGQLDSVRLALHFDRLCLWLQKLGLQLPQLFAHQAADFPRFISRCLDLLQAPNDTYSRLKLTIWRMPGGLYAPMSEASQYAIAVTPYQAPPQYTAFAGISDRVVIKKSWISGAKTLNALDYVIAAQERTQQNWDEIILTNGAGIVIEAGAANLFAIMPDGTVHLAGFNQGAVHGVMMMAVLKLLEQRQIRVCTDPFSLDQLMNAQAVFTTNVAGIKSLQAIANKKLPNPDHQLISELRSLLAPYQLV